MTNPTPALPLPGLESPATTPPEPQPFDVCGDLPTGVTVLEASAGTGKTFTIAALAARYVADGTPLHQLLIVTFTRMATGELRDRVRQRLVSADPRRTAPPHRGRGAAPAGFRALHDERHAGGGRRSDRGVCGPGPAERWLYRGAGGAP